MMDQAQKVTNQELKKMENHLKKMYSQARRDVGRDWYKYMESIKPEGDRLLKAYEDAKASGDKELIKKTGKEYGQFLRQQTYMNDRYKSMLNTTTTKLANVNEIALSYLNGKMPKVYATNYNQVSKDMPAGISFDLVDETTVKNLVKDNPKLLPTKKLDIPKDKRWNQKAINSQVLQSIIQGESITKMAKRLTPIMDRNRNSAIRNARTMTTGAQNKGRLDSYKAAQDNGVVLHKVWMATNSERTRAWHAALNGVEVEIDKPFENDYGKIMFPGDPTAHPGNVYNCRCTLTTKIIGFRRADGSIKYIEGEEPKATDENTFKVVDGKDISDTWTRRADTFDFEIEDVINAQGFDGKPRVVSANEFDRYVQEANGGNGFIAQRNYSAPTQEILDEYREQLYNGKWYVDCSTGGAQYGQGMYVAADYTGKITDGMKNEMAHYQKLGKTRATKIVDNEQIDKAVEVQWGRIKSDISFPYDNDGKILHNEEEVKEELRKAIGNLYGGEIEKLYGVTGNNKFAIENKFSYTETLTLDPSARIISHDDLIKLREESKSVLINEELEKVYTGDDLYMAKRVAGSMNDSERNEWSDFRSNNRDKWLEFEEKNESAIGTITDSAQIKYDKLRNMDIGAYATLKGYDAINAVGHGASGSYTVILNRTKVIFKGE